MRKAVLSIVGFLALAGIVGYVATWDRSPLSRQSGGGGVGAASRAPEKAVGAVGSDEGFAGVVVPGTANRGGAGLDAGGGCPRLDRFPPSVPTS